MPARFPSLIQTHASSGRAHLMGICGAGMKALAELLSENGWQVSGCDQDPDPRIKAHLESLGIPVSIGHNADHLASAPDLLIYSAAIPAQNSERQAAAERGIPQFSYVEVLYQLVNQQWGIAVAGTHGKSTTTGWIGDAFKQAGLSPTLICGAETLGENRSGWAGQQPIAVAEACEYRQHFLGFRPQVAVLLGIEPDHFDCYASFEQMEEAYRTFAQQVPQQGCVIYRADCDVSSRISKQVTARTVSFSYVDSTANWFAEIVDVQDGRDVIRVHHGGRVSEPVLLPVPGKHQIQNGLATMACVAEALQQRSVWEAVTPTQTSAPMADEEIFERAVESVQAFAGLKRRFEIVREEGNRVWIDDYAHHPTELLATLEAVSSSWPERAVIGIFQSHQLSRTRLLFEEFAQALAQFDQIFQLPVYAAREIAGEEQRNLAIRLNQRISELGGNATLVETLDQVWGTVETELPSAAVILTLGAGNLTRVHYEFS